MKTEVPTGRIPGIRPRREKRTLVEKINVMENWGRKLRLW